MLTRSSLLLSLLSFSCHPFPLIIYCNLHPFTLFLLFYPHALHFPFVFAYADLLHGIKRHSPKALALLPILVPVSPPFLLCVVLQLNPTIPEL